MNIKCPNCGAVHSLDSLLSTDAAGDLLVMIAELDAAIAKPALRYLGLFRPDKTQLTFARTAKLLAELLPSIKAGEISRDGVVYPAPPEAWIYGFQTALDARNRLKLPLKSHGWLFEVIAGWQPQATGTVVATADKPAANTKLRQGVSVLSQWAANDWLKQEIAAGFAVLAAMNLQGRPAAQDLAVVAELWVQRLVSRDEKPCEQYDRVRIQAAFKTLQDMTAWPNVNDLIRNLPPRMIPRTALDKPKPDREKGRVQMERVKQSLNGKGASNG
ncbi:hypothetical protein [Neisseria sp. S1]|uniref:hypothetical protein n=1 Tax=Neisseria sp. S1 TaxID=3318354 RepID=UPI003A898964